jgi:hypothetical protein
MTIIGVSVLFALVVAAIEALGLVAEKLGLTGGKWNVIDLAPDNFTALGYLVVGIFVASGLASLAIYRVMGYDKIGSAYRWPPVWIADGQVPSTLTTASIVNPRPCLQRTERARS